MGLHNGIEHGMRRLGLQVHIHHLRCIIAKVLLMTDAPGRRHLDPVVADPLAVVIRLGCLDEVPKVLQVRHLLQLRWNPRQEKPLFNMGL